MKSQNDDNIISLEISDELDLHHFKAAEVPSLLEEYFLQAIKRKIFEIRLIHGKGQGFLRNRVHSLLSKMKSVSSFHKDGENWGATLVLLEKNT